MMNRYSRLIIFGYIGLLHCVLFLTLHNFSHSSYVAHHQDTFCERIQMISPQSPHPFHVFSKLSDDTMRVGVVGLMPHIIENIELHVEQLHVPNGCRYGTMLELQVSVANSAFLQAQQVLVPLVPSM